ncbi:disulfide-isomerase, partial [Coprinopsis sp. MPI-PUGE-AT-0042]
SVALLVGALASLVAASNVVELTPDNFDSVIGKGKPALVEFGHCKNLAPTYEELADAFAHAKDRVVIAKVDADGAGRSLGQKFGVKGFPTLKWIDEVGKDSEYNGGRDLESLAGFVTKQSGVRSKIPGPPEPAYTVLDSNNYAEITTDPSKHVLVAFTVDAQWCRDCRDVKLIWEKVAAWYKPDEHVVIGIVNLDEPKNSMMTSKEGIESYPTIKFYAKGNKTPEVYTGGKTDKDIVTFLNKKTGTARIVGGGLNLVAGRIPELDEIAEKFVAASKSARAEIVKEAKVLAQTINKTSAAQYLKIMEKLASGASSYVEKERKRLKTIASKADLKKQDEIKIKDNILRAFQTEDARDKHDL